MVHQIKLRLANAFLVCGAGPILIDTGEPGEGRRLLDAVGRLGVRPADLALILHTHVHSDHVGSTAELRRLGVRAPAAYHRGDQPLMDRGDNGPLTGVGLRGRVVARLFRYARFPTFAADLFAEDGLRLDEFGVAGRVVHTPGHTAGSVSLRLDTGEAVVGDLVMGGYLGGKIWPRRPNYHYVAEDLGQLHRSLAALLASPVETLHAGHGGPLAAGDVRARFGRALRDAGPGSRADRPLRLGVFDDRGMPLGLIEDVEINMFHLTGRWRPLDPSVTERWTRALEQDREVVEPGEEPRRRYEHADYVWVGEDGPWKCYEVVDVSRDTIHLLSRPDTRDG